MTYPFPGAKKQAMKIAASELEAVVLMPKGMPSDYPSTGQDSLSITLAWADAQESDGVTRFLGVTLAKEIVQDYDGVSVYKPADELKHAVRFLPFRPIVNDHPSTDIVRDPRSVCGFVENPIFKDASLIADLAITDSILVDAIKSGDKREVSIGFHADWDHTAGTFGDKPYTAVQKNILIDHVAVVKAGRCSLLDGCGIHLDTSTPSPEPHCGKAGCELAIISMNDAVASRLSALEAATADFTAATAATLSIITESIKTLLQDSVTFAAPHHPAGDNRSAVDAAYLKAFAG